MVYPVGATKQLMTKRENVADLVGKQLHVLVTPILCKKSASLSVLVVLNNLSLFEMSIV